LNDMIKRVGNTCWTNRHINEAGSRQMIAAEGEKGLKSQLGRKERLNLSKDKGPKKTGGVFSARTAERIPKSRKKSPPSQVSGA